MLLCQVLQKKSYLYHPDVPVPLPVGQAHVAPPVGGPNLELSRLGVPQDEGLPGALALGVAEAEEGEREVGSKVQKLEGRVLKFDGIYFERQKKNSSN